MQGDLFSERQAKHSNDGIWIDSCFLRTDVPIASQQRTANGVGLTSRKNAPEVGLFRFWFEPMSWL